MELGERVIARDTFRAMSAQPRIPNLIGGAAMVRFRGIWWWWVTGITGRNGSDKEMAPWVSQKKLIIKERHILLLDRAFVAYFINQTYNIFSSR